MEIVEEKKLTNLFFKISITIGLVGIIMYFLQEIIASSQAYAYTAFIVIGDLLGILAMIAIILWLFLPKHEVLILNMAILLGLTYVLTITFSHFFAPNYITSVLNYFEELFVNQISFIGLLLVTLTTLALIVVFSMRFSKRTQFGIFEKFSIILWFIIVGVFELASLFYIRNVEVFVNPLQPNLYLGLTFLESKIALILFLAFAVILILNFFVGINKKILQLLVLLLVNVTFFALAIATTNYIGFSLPDNTYVISILGNIFVLIGTVGLAVCTFFVLQAKYPKSLAKQSDSK